jgi:hypothetical protein
MDTIATIQPNIWVLLTEKPGDNDQCLALAEALDRPTVVKRLDRQCADGVEERAMIADLLAETAEGEQQRSAIGLRGPWPRVVICCGRRSDEVGFWIKRQSGGYTKVVSIGRAHRPVASYDLLVALPQFLVPERSNVVRLPLPMARRRDGCSTIDGASARSNIVPVPKPWFTLLLGGDVKQFEACERTLMDAARRAQMAADRHGGSVVISTSRRTPAASLAAVESVLDRPYVYRWSDDAAEENPYETLLRQSAALFVTADSISMIVDCCASSAPTYVIEYPEHLDLRRRWRRDLFRHIRRAVEGFRDRGLGRAGDRLDDAQEWLHAQGFLRYPRDLRQIHTSVYEMGLAQPANDFDPAMLPARKVANDLTEISGIRHAAARCLALSRPFAAAAE